MLEALKREMEEDLKGESETRPETDTASQMKRPRKTRVTEGKFSEKKPEIQRPVKDRLDKRNNNNNHTY